MDKDEYHRAVARLRQRSAAELADFVASLLFDNTTGVGVYARALAAADSQAATRIIGDAIGCGGHFLRHDRYHQARGAAQRLDWTLEAIARCVLPHDAPAALQLVAQCFEHDTDFGPDDLDEISDAFRRAADLFRKAAKGCPPGRAEAESERLMAEDRAGYRIWLQTDPPDKPRNNDAIHVATRGYSTDAPMRLCQEAAVAMRSFGTPADLAKRGHLLMAARTPSSSSANSAFAIPTSRHIASMTAIRGQTSPFTRRPRSSIPS